MDPPTAAVPKPCCVCDEPGGKHCTKCKSRHYCSKACQLVDWNEGGHKAQCRHMTAAFQDRLLDELMPAKLKIKEEPAVVEDVAPADGLKVAARLSAVRAENAPADGAEANASALNGMRDWEDNCGICLDVLQVGFSQTFMRCCCKSICTGCHKKCRQHDMRCPLCRSPPYETDAEWLRQMQAHVDKGNAVAQMHLGHSYRQGQQGLTKNPKRAFDLCKLSAAQGYAIAQNSLGSYYRDGTGVKMDNKRAVLWYRRAAEQGYPLAQTTLGHHLSVGLGVAKSQAEALRWWRLAATQECPEALHNLGICYYRGLGVPQDDREALRFLRRAVPNGRAESAAGVAHLEEKLGLRPRG